MSLSFQPKTEEQLKEESRKLLQEGDFDFEVLTAEDALSKGGAPMIKLKLGVFRNDASGGQQWVWDYLMNSAEWKLRHFCDTVGLLQKYQAGSLAAPDCVGRSGRARIVVQKGQNGYQDSNKVKDYICRPAKPIVPPTTQAAQQPAEDNVPF
jgi:hypothetical protein